MTDTAHASVPERNHPLGALILRTSARSGERDFPTVAGPGCYLEGCAIAKDVSNCLQR